MNITELRNDMKQRLIVCIAAVMLALMHGVCTYAAVIDSGKCGDNVTWSLDDNGLLTISGTGDMYDYDGGNRVPWYNMTSDIDVVSISEGVSRIGDYAFRVCGSLRSVVIPNSVTAIGKDAFSYCRSLTGVVIPNSVTAIEENTFSYCYDLRSVVIPNSVTAIGESAFSGCYNLRSVVIPNSVTAIGDYVFYECSSLRSVVIPNSVTTIGKRAFASCNLSKIYVADDNKIYDSRSESNAIIKTATNTLIAGCGSTVIPSSVTAIGEEAFYKCFNLTSVVIPNSVTAIGESAFSGCYNLTSVVIPNSVTAIGKDAFSDCY